MLNLRVEMERKHISTVALATHLGVSRQTAWNKVNCVTEFTVSEAIKIHHGLFPEYDIEYLFSEHSSNC